ncbi:MAG: AAA family ATPase [Sphingobacteriales bacterium]|jgi:SpoVK/Ycf46/Vps4 family AAA+-type ATPase|nr:AAA family ATPase [Sphingobacteriales bacterium]MBP9140080.1 AAA family ATPase [Chitinophagales bacterium]MDA0197837.1 AAA family ATPase [Bacteroidota bacterium]MBK6889941.1 AAA family ATPase [Sphingobacteriales bacterium]MBK7527535.1 AAA family ATPase [Sphingobacteriales bacterium]
MPPQHPSDFVPYKVRDLKVYGSAEWLANEQKKYRRVYDRSETTYIYAELSFYNKLFDEEDWTLDVTLKCFSIKDGKRTELCNLTSQKTITKDANIVYVREGWGHKKHGLYWRAGAYEWEAFLNTKSVATQAFYIEDIGMVTDDHNPFFNVAAVKIFEGPSNGVNFEDRTYYKNFDAANTRYVFAELSFDNLIEAQPWNCEVNFKFYNDARQLKGETIELFAVKPEDKSFTITSGWGSNDVGSWYQDRYTLEVVFMDKLIAVLPFEVGESFEEGMNDALLAAEGVSFTPMIETEATSLEEVMQQLNELVGLKAIKKRITDYTSYLQFLKIRTDKGFEDQQRISLHSVFTGNPGTGKTTVARMLGQIYKHMGLLSKGHVHDVDRADLVGEYIGQTAPKVKEAIKQARGGVLFIDEAYSLSRVKDDAKDFGREVIEIIIKEMSDGKGDLAIIVAGYPAEMRTFIDTNPGLRSRFSQWFEFPDYLPQELSDIAEYAAKHSNVILHPQAKSYLYTKIVDAYRTRNQYFGNARFVFSLIDQAKINLGLRVMQTENPKNLTGEELSTIFVEDVEKIFKEQERRIPDIPIDETILQETLLELDQMIGLESVKTEIAELVRLVKFYRDQNKEVLNRFSLHSVFVGNPGTGKTTVARILAKIFKALGILERGHLVECDRQSLVAGYVGQTAIKTSEMIDQAIGGVLFIDEAYSLTQVGSNSHDFGREVIETLIKRMEDQKGLFAVVVAGYTDNMKTFIESNPGLKSRFDRVLKFEDLSAENLMTVALAELHKEEYVLDEAANAALTNYMSLIYKARDKYFGNGRTAIKIIREIIRRQNLRIAQLDKAERTPDVLNTITLDDVKALDPNMMAFGERKLLGFQTVNSVGE